MHNAQKPALEDLPTSRQLLKSTGIAAASAVAILVTVVLPAEYGIDPTRIGRVLDLTQWLQAQASLTGDPEGLPGGDEEAGSWGKAQPGSQQLSHRPKNLIYIVQYDKGGSALSQRMADPRDRTLSSAVGLCGASGARRRS